MAENNGFIKAGYKDFLEYNPATFEIKYGDYRFNGDYFGLKQKRVTVNPNDVKSAADLRQALGFQDKSSQASRLFGGMQQVNMGAGQGPFGALGNGMYGNSMPYGDSQYTEQFTAKLFEAMRSGKPLTGATPITMRSRKMTGSNPWGTVSESTSGFGTAQRNEDGTYDIIINPVLDSSEAFTQKVHDATWDIYNQQKNGRGKTPKTSLLA